MIGNKFYVLSHEGAVHADEFHWEGVGEKFLLNGYRLFYDRHDSVGKLVLILLPTNDSNGNYTIQL